jgi:hypothetical protein
VTFDIKGRIEMLTDHNIAYSDYGKQELLYLYLGIPPLFLPMEN